MSELNQTSNRRRVRLHDSSQYLQFTWKADLVESWISEWDVWIVHPDIITIIPTENKEGHVRSEEIGKDTTAIQALLTKHVWIIIHMMSLQSNMTSS